MATRKQKAKANKQLKKINDLALKGFDKAKVSAALDTMSGQQEAENVGKHAKGNAALSLCEQAASFYSANMGDALQDVIEQGWRENIQQLAMEKAISGSLFFEVVPGKNDKPDTVKRKGYGRNVLSIADGIVHFGLNDWADPRVQDHVPEESNGDVSYRILQAAVQAERAKERREADPDAAAFADTLEAFSETLKELRDAVKATGDTLVVEETSASVAALTAALKAVAEEQDAAEAEEAEAVAA